MLLKQRTNAILNTQAARLKIVLCCRHLSIGFESYNTDFETKIFCILKMIKLLMLKTKMLYYKQDVREFLPLLQVHIGLNGDQGALGRGLDGYQIPSSQISVLRLLLHM